MTFPPKLLSFLAALALCSSATEAAEKLPSSARLVAASATSSSADSSPVTCLLDPKCNGKWSPGVRDDSGHDEGVYFRFDGSLVHVDFIDVIFAGKIDSDFLELEIYLDGKRGGPEWSPSFSTWPSEKPGETTCRISSRDGFRDQPLNQFIQSFYVKLNTQGFKAGNTKAPPTIKKIVLYDGHTAELDPESQEPISFTPKDPWNIKIPQMVRATVSASSILNPVFAYDPSHLFDSKSDMAWSSDGKKSTGIGERITLNFTTPVDIASLMLWNGYQRSETHFTANARVAAMKISSDRGSTAEEVKLKDASDAQTVPLSKPLLGVKSLTFQIEKTYPGLKYKDVLLSEMRLLDPAGNLIIPLVDPVKPTIPPSLTPLIDRSYSAFLQAYLPGPLAPGISVLCSQISLRVRANGTFVVYNNDLISEGNWEPKGSGLRVFGKKYTTSIPAASYLDESPEDEGTASIFQNDVALQSYSELSKPERLKILQQEKARLSFQTPKTGPAVSWRTSIREKSDYSAASEAALLEAVDADLLPRKPVFVKSSMFSGLVLPTDQLGRCSPK